MRSLVLLLPIIGVAACAEKVCKGKLSSTSPDTISLGDNEGIVQLISKPDGQVRAEMNRRHHDRCFLGCARDPYYEYIRNAPKECFGSYTIVQAKTFECRHNSSSGCASLGLLPDRHISLRLGTSYLFEKEREQSLWGLPQLNINLWKGEMECLRPDRKQPEGFICRKPRCRGEHKLLTFDDIPTIRTFEDTCTVVEMPRGYGGLLWGREVKVLAPGSNCTFGSNSSNGANRMMVSAPYVAYGVNKISISAPVDKCFIPISFFVRSRKPEPVKISIKYIPNKPSMGMKRCREFTIGCQQSGLVWFDERFSDIKRLEICGVNPETGKPVSVVMDNFSVCINHIHRGEYQDQDQDQDQDEDE